MNPIEKLRQGARRASGYLDLYNMTGSDEMKQRCDKELEEVLYNKEIEEAFDRMAWEDELERQSEDYFIDP